MPLIREPDTEVLPGYRLIEPLGRGGFGEVWKCEAPGGFLKAIKFVEGDGSLALGQAPADAEMTTIQHIKAIRHPFLLSMERVEVIDGDLLIVMELADKNLLDLFNERRQEGLPGVPRAELLHYLREAADVLDLLNFEHGLQHLDIKPANLFLVSGHVKVADFGLVCNLAERNILAGAGPSALSAISPRYGAPELFKGVISPFSDQYSLAIVFQEMLSGSFPFNGKNARQLAMEHTGGTPNLTPLAVADQVLIGRALAKNPRERFANCRQLVDALAGSPAAPLSVAVPRDDVATGRASDTSNELQMTGTVPVRPASAKYVPELHFVTCLGRSPSVEAWEALTPQGTRRLVKFLYGATGRTPRRKEEAIALLQSMVHTALPPLLLLPAGPGCLVAITDLIEDSVRDRFQQARTHGAKGLPRRLLLDWLRAAAEALDELARTYHVQHKALNPRGLLLDGDRLYLGDFGFQALIWEPVGQVSTLLQGRYAAPELPEAEPTPRCDVYSLAVIYQEMLTGVHPLRGRQITSPNVNPLGNAERTVVACALAIDPDERFATCTEFVQALEDSYPGSRPAPADAPVEKQSKAELARLIADSTNFVPASEPETWLSTPDGRTTLQCRFTASLPPSGAHSRFDAFRTQWQAQLVRTEPNGLVLSVGPRNGGWKRFFGQVPSITVEIQWNTPKPALPEVVVRICSAESGRPGEETAFQETAPQLLDSLRTHLQGHSERRGQERLLWAHPVTMSFRSADGRSAETFTCQAKNISLTGMGLYLPRATAGAHLTVALTTPTHPEAVLVPGTCVRVQRCGEDWCEAGVLFD